MKRRLVTFSLMLILASFAFPQVVRPPYILGKGDVRIKSKNFLAGRKPQYGSSYQIYNDRRPGGPSINFDKKSNEFEIVTGADNSSRSIRQAKQELQKSETVLLRITGVASNDRCKLKVLMRIVVPGTTDGGVAYDHLPSCGEF